MCEMGLLTDEDGRNKQTERRTDIHEEFLLARRPTYLKINLDNILQNLEIIRSRIANHTKIIAIVKGNAYGHGSIPISRFLQQHGVQHFAVATALEGEELRQAGIGGYIQVLGNGSFEEIPTLYANELTPTVATTEFLHEWAEFTNGRQEVKGNPRNVVIKIDTGMSRNGCRPEKFQELLKVCDHHKILIHSIMTHFAQSWDDPDFTNHQLKLFMETVRPHRYRGFKLHVANSGAINNNIGVNLDFVRPGISLYGQPPDTSDFCSSLSISMGYLPAISWIARPSLVKQLKPGDVVGYDKTYTCENQETVATFALGYADGYHRNLFNHGYLTTPTGIKCPLVGRVSMDSITVRLPEDVTEFGTFNVMTSDTNNVNSSLAISRKCKTIPYEVCTDLDKRLPRLYETDGKVTNEICSTFRNQE